MTLIAAGVMGCRFILLKIFTTERASRSTEARLRGARKGLSKGDLRVTEPHLTITHSEGKAEV